MNRKGVFAVVVLGAIVVVGAGIAGPARFEGVRFVGGALPVPTGAPPSQPARSLAPLRHALPSAPKGGHLDLLLLGGIAALLAALAIALLLWRWWRHRVPSAPIGGVDPDGLDALEGEGPVAAPGVRRGLDAALDVLADDRAPNDAIIDAWLGLQAAAEESGLRRGPAETPTEFTSRVLGRFTSDAAALRVLLGSYLAVRFGEHIALPDEVARVRSAVRGLAASWREPADALLDDAGTD